MAAVDEDTELRDLVAQTLESSGVLGKIKAQLRASVFLALEEVDPEKQKVPFVNPDLKQYLNTANGALAFSLILEFLEYFRLEFTNAVFVPECSRNGERTSNSELRSLLKISEPSTTPSGPILSDIISRLQRGAGDHVPSQSHSQLSAEQLEQARERFKYYDQDRNGLIDKEELRCLFIDTFPAFNRNMLDRYVNDEFRAADRDFSSNSAFKGSGIDFNEFTEMYQRLFLQCQSVVSGDVKDIVNAKKNSRPKSDINRKSLFEEISEKDKNVTSDPKPPEDRLESLDDQFFDDILVPAGVSKTYPRLDSSPRDSDTKSSTSDRTISDMKSLIDERKSESKSLDKKLSEIEYVPTDDYDDDFSSMHTASLKSSGRSHKSGGHTEKDEAKEGEEDDIEEDISIECDELLESQSSTAGFDEITTDQTVSQQDNGFDYAEEFAF